MNSYNCNLDYSVTKHNGILFNHSKEEKVNVVPSVKDEIQKNVQIEEENVQLTTHLLGNDKVKLHFIQSIIRTLTNGQILLHVPHKLIFNE